MQRGEDAHDTEGTAQEHSGEVVPVVPRFRWFPALGHAVDLGAEASKLTEAIEATEGTATPYRASAESAERSRSPSTGDDAHPGGDDLGGDIFEVMATPSTWAPSS